MTFGFLNINKPSGMTAHDVVSRVRRILRIKHVGHGGTLDPMATGVLPIAVGKACRLLRYLDGTKVYLAEILLGTSTTTDDIEGEIIASSSNLPPETAVLKAIRSFHGRLEQVPPAYSAVHHKGERLYNLARKGEAPTDIPARSVMVYGFEPIALALPVVQARIECGAGTYIRALARDLGQALSCGGCLKTLVREKAGPFELESAITLEDLERLKSEDKESQLLVSPHTVLGLPCLPLPSEQIRRLAMGQSLPIDEGFALSLQPDKPRPGGESSDKEAIIVTYEGELIAVCRKTAENRLSPEVVIAHAD